MMMDGEWSGVRVASKLDAGRGYCCFGIGGHVGQRPESRAVCKASSMWEILQPSLATILEID
jgi:hypothetical protein